MKDSGPIGLNLTVPIAQIWMNLTSNVFIKITRKRKLKALRSLKKYMDDTFGISTKNNETALKLSL